MEPYLQSALSLTKRALDEDMSQDIGTATVKANIIGNCIGLAKCEKDQEFKGAMMKMITDYVNQND